MAYIPTNQNFNEIIYSGDAKHRIRIIFNNIELENADLYCESFRAKPRLLPDDGNKRFSLDNFVSTEAELILHNIDETIIQDQVKILIGTLVDKENNIYEDVPIGTFNIQDNPITDKDKITIELLDNASLFDFGYNAKPLIDSNNGRATKLQILQDICIQANVTCNINSFLGDTDYVAIYDSTITARAYVSYIAEQAGAIATINRDGELIFIYINNLTTQKIPLSIVEKYEIGERYQIQRVVYEDAIRKFETSDDETLDTLFINSANPYISNQEQIDNILLLVNTFEIDSLSTGKIFGNPAIDKFDIIEIYGYYEYDEYGNPRFVDDETTIVAKTLATYELTYNGKLYATYDTQVGKEERTENVTLHGEATFQKYAKTSIDNINNQVEIIVGEQDEQQNQITQIIANVNNIQNLFQITGGNNLIKNSQFLLTDDVWDFSSLDESNIVYNNDDVLYDDYNLVYGGETENQYHTELGEGYNANLIGRTTSLGNIVMRNIKVSTKEGNIANIKTNQPYNLGFYYTLDENTQAQVTLVGANNNVVVYQGTFTEPKSSITKVTHSFIAYDTDYTLIIETSTVIDGYFTIYDLMLNSGDEKPWEPAMSEIYSTVLKMSQLGLQIYCTGSNIATLMSSQGFQIRRFENGNLYEIVTEFTKDGFISKKGELEEIEIDDYVQKTITYQGYKTFILYKKAG